MVSLNRGRNIFSIVTLVASLGTGLPPGEANAHGFGRVSLAPGEELQIQAGAIYGHLRICNELESPGTVVLTIDGGTSRSLAPGICTEGTGANLDFHNGSGAPATIVYHVFPPALDDGPR
jgi:hypothetical protein